MKKEELEGKIRYWEGYLSGMVSNVDSAELFVALPPDLQAIALEMYKVLDKSPEASRAIIRFLHQAVGPVVKRFITDLRSLQGDGQV